MPTTVPLTKLELKDGDCLVAKVPAGWTDDQIDEFYSEMISQTPEGVDIGILIIRADSGINLGVQPKAEVLKLLDARMAELKEMRDYFESMDFDLISAEAKA